MNTTATTGFATSTFAFTAPTTLTAPEIIATPEITAFLATYGISVAKEDAGWVIRSNGTPVDAPQQTRRDARSVAIAYALDYMN